MSIDLQRSMIEVAWPDFSSERENKSESGLVCFLVQGILKGITVQLTSYLTGLDQSVLQIKAKNVSSQTADSNPVKQEVNRTLILPPFSIPCLA
jgi:hypothetical protein